MDCDVIVIGAGIAGLHCAATLSAAGLDVEVWEAAERVGGRVRSERVDGFTVDRGFQLLNPAYPAVRRWIDLPGLQLASFAPGVRVRQSDGSVVLADPRRAPARSWQTLRSGYLRPTELWPLARWALPALRSVRRLLAGPDESLQRSLDDARATGALRTEVLEPFLAGVLLEEAGTTSAAFARLLLRSFLRGTPGVPAAGMQALPDQLAARLAAPPRLAHPVDSLTPVTGGVRVSGAGTTITARAAVVATDPRSAERLAGVTAPPMNGVVTDWFATDEPPSPDPLLVLDARGRRGGHRAGPVLNTAVVSNAAPSYAPPGRHLVQASCLLDTDGAPPALAIVRRQLAEVYEHSTSGWEPLARHVIPEALPAQPPPLQVRSPVVTGPGVFVCGDHRDTASLQGALVSGRRAARRVCESLGVAPPG